MAKRADELAALRMLISALRNKEISLRPALAKASVDAEALADGSAGGQGGKAELADQQIIEVIAGEIKKRKDSVLAYRQGNRQDLADKEANEIKILEKYLPAQLADEEVEKIIEEIIASGASDFGKVMSQAMARVKGKADGSRVGEIVKKLLNK